jgi:hypothetical protein
VLLSSGDSFPHLIQKRRSQLGFVTYLLNCPRTNLAIRPPIVTQQTEKLRYKRACYVQAAIEFLIGDEDINTDIFEQSVGYIDKSVVNLYPINVENWASS